MSEGARSPEQSRRASIKERFSKLIPDRFRPSKQPQELTPTPSESVTVTTKSWKQVSGEKPAPTNSVPEPIPSPAPARDNLEAVKTTHPEPIIETNTIKTPEIEPRATGIATALSQKLKERNLTVPEIETKGVPAIIGTNETSTVDFFEAVQAKNPDGYLIGVGAGNAFTLIHGFRADLIPKGVIFADIDPRAVAVGKMVINGLKHAESAQDFERKFFGMPEEDFQHSIKHLIASEQNSSLKERWLKMDTKTWQDVWQQLGKREYFTWDEKSEAPEGQNIDTIGAMLDKFSVLKQLAMEDNIAMNYADFTDASYIEAVRELPGFQDSSNIVYFSNIVDHITERGTQLANLSILEGLKTYEQSSKPPVFIDTLGQTLNYFLRARQSMPKFTEEDFSYIGSQPRGRKPKGLLFADAP